MWNIIIIYVYLKWEFIVDYTGYLDENLRQNNTG